MWKLLQSKRGFESSPSRRKEDKDDALRKSPATIKWDAKGRGAKLGFERETFAVIQIVDKEGHLVAVGADFYDEGPMRERKSIGVVDKDGKVVGPPLPLGPDVWERDETGKLMPGVPKKGLGWKIEKLEHNKLEKHAEPRILRALERAVSGQVPEGSLIVLVDQDVCENCRPKLEKFAKDKGLRMVIAHVPERPNLAAAGKMASPKTTSRTSLQDLRNRQGNPVKITFRKSFERTFAAPTPATPAPMPRPPMPKPTLKSRMGAVGGTIAEAAIGILLDLLSAKIREKIDQKKFEERMRELLPKIEQKKQEAYTATISVEGDLSKLGQLYYIIQIRVTTQTTIWVAGRGSGMIPGSPRPEIGSVFIAKDAVNTAGPVQEKSKTGEGGHAVIFLEQSQLLTYSEPVALQ